MIAQMLTNLVEVPAALWLVALWFLLLGGVVGSFLNVVAYRLPAGKSLVHPGSHCPRCNHPIRWHDNVPVLGWLMLRGRCRDCGLPISPRYPAVEATSALMFFAVALVEIVLDGANLPEAGGALARPVPSAIELVVMSAYHCFLLATLLAAALIDWDGKPVSGMLFIPALVVGTVLPWVIGDWLRPLRALPGSGGMVDLAVGLAAGLVVQPFIMRARGQSGPRLAWATVGAFVGWQALLAIAALTAIEGLATRAWFGAQRRLAYGRLLVAAIIVMLILWPYLPFLDFN